MTATIPALTRTNNRGKDLHLHGYQVVKVQLGLHLSISLAVYPEYYYSFRPTGRTPSATFVGMDTEARLS